jgi:predicted nucleic acid-binding protein
VKQVFLDTVGLVALWNQSDQWHGAARASFQTLPSSVVLFTTTFVLLECGNAVCRTPFRSDVEDLRVRLENDGNLIRPGTHVWQEAWQNYVKGHAGDAGIVDQVSFDVMKKRRVGHVFSNDQHFRAAGFTTLF